jgi:glycosyltransferase involved in cell wall biosynthesis
LTGIPYVCDWYDWIGKGGMLDNRSVLYKLTLGAWDNYFEVVDKRHADGIVTISKCLQDRAVALGIPKERTTIIHGGADVNGEAPVDKYSARKELGLAVDSVILGYAGMGLIDCVDLRPFFEALPALKKEIKNLTWFSTGDSLPKDAKERYEIGKEHIYLGWLDENCYKKYLAAADILLLPLKDTRASKARWPNKMGDYLAAGRPIITTNIGEIASYARRFPNSVYIVEWNSQSIASGIKALLSNAGLRETMRANNLHIARKCYSWDEKAKELHAFYERILRMNAG